MWILFIAHKEWCFTQDGTNNQFNFLKIVSYMVWSPKLAMIQAPRANCAHTVDDWFEILIALDPTQVKHSLAEIKLKSQSATCTLLME